MVEAEYDADGEHRWEPSYKGVPGDRRVPLPGQQPTYTKVALTAREKWNRGVERAFKEAGSTEEGVLHVLAHVGAVDTVGLAWHTGVSESALRVLLKTLKKDDLVRTVKDGWSLTNAGWERINTTFKMLKKPADESVRERMAALALKP